MLQCLVYVLRASVPENELHMTPFGCRVQWCLLSPMLVWTAASEKTVTQVWGVPRRSCTLLAVNGMVHIFYVGVGTLQNP